MGTKISSEISKDDADLEARKQSERKAVVYGHMSRDRFELQNEFSSYEGIKSKTSDGSINNSSISRHNSRNSRLSTSSMTDDKDDSGLKVPTKFTWREGGNHVYVTGNFANWKQWFLMNKSEENPKEFQLTLDLPRGVYQFKFIVDKVWKYADSLPKIQDEHGNLNNIINNSETYYLLKESKTIRSRRRDKSVCESAKPDLSNQYMQFLPAKCELNCDAPVVPGNYQSSFNINTQTQQCSIGNPNFIRHRKILICSSSDSSYKQIARAPHVNLNLLCSDVCTLKSSSILKISTTLRIKEKYVTLIYYKPIN